MRAKICPTCGIEYGVPEAYDDERGKDGKAWYCPNGHSVAYRETESVRLKRERDQLAQRLTIKDEMLADGRRYREELERSLAAQKGVATKLRKRALKLQGDPKVVQLHKKPSLGRGLRTGYS